MRAAATILLFWWLVRSIDAATTVWIDTDPSIGAPWREVDDAYALVLAFHSPEIRIAGISSTYGNAGVKRTTAVTRNLVRRFGTTAAVTEHDVYPGAATAKSRGTSTAATVALAHALQKESLTYVALGPLTNLATFLQLHPRLATRIERVIFIGGRTPGQALAFGKDGALQIHDANVFKDPEAARVVVSANIPILLAAPEISGRLLLTRSDARQLAGSGGAGAFLQRNSRVWLWFWTAIIRNPGGPLFDSLAVVAAVQPELAPTERRYAAVISTGELSAARERFAKARPVRFCTAVTTRAHSFAIARLRGEERAPGGR